MIIKGNRHGNGAKLAAYLLDGGKHGERVADPELYGFGLHPDDISKAFRSLDALGQAKGIENPLFHIQIRLPKGDTLTPEQWDITRNRVLKTAGLEGQPHARVFHTDEKTGELHCHLAVSLIDEQTHHAKALPFYKLRFKKLARTLEREFDLTPVKNYREGPIKYGATKKEEQQAQRLGFDKEAVRNSIRQCWDSTDCGLSFEAALADQGLILADARPRRDYVVIDPKGGVHALGKRILDVPVKQIREKLDDLDRDNIPTVEHAREFLLSLPRDRIDKLTRELAAAQNELKDEIQYEDALHRAAIEKEERERRFAEPEQETRAGQHGETQPEPDINEGLKATLAETNRLIAAHLLRLSEEDPALAEKRLQDVRDRPGIQAALEQLIAEQRQREDEELQRQFDETTKALAADLYEKLKKYPNRYRTHWEQHVSPGLAAEVEKLAAAEAAREYAQHDPARDETAWLDAVARAAIAKEQREREFIEPRAEKPQPEKETRGGAMNEQERDRQQQPVPPPNLKGAAAHFREALQHSDTPEAFALALDEWKIMLACATHEDAHRSRAKASFARQFGNFAPEYNEGEIVAVTYTGQVYKLSERNTGMKPEDMAAFLKPLDRRSLKGIKDTIEIQTRIRHDQNELHRATTPKPEKPQQHATGLTMQEAPATSPGLHFADAARQTAQPEAAPGTPADLRGTTAEIWTAYNSRRVDREWQRENADGTKDAMRDRITLKGGRDPLKFGTALDERGLILARATKEEAEQSRKEAEHWKQHGETRPVYREGEFVAINRQGDIYSLNKRTTGHAAKEVQAFLNKADWKALPGIEAARETMKTRSDQRLADARDRAAIWDAIRLKNATRKHRGRNQGRTGEPAAPNLARASRRAIGGIFGALGKLADGFSLDALTPKEKYEAAKRDDRNEREADKNADYAAYIAELSERWRRDQQRQAEQRHQEPEPHRDRQR